MLVDALRELVKEARRRLATRSIYRASTTLSRGVAWLLWDDLVKEMMARAQCGISTLRFERYVEKAHEDVVRAHFRAQLAKEGLCFRADVYNPEPDEESDPHAMGHLVVEVCWQSQGFCLTCGDVHSKAGSSNGKATGFEPVE
jgi:hypothetical protein